MTEFTSIYDKFLSKIEDYGYAQMSEEDAHAHFYTYLQSAIARFGYMCRKDLSLRSEKGFLEPLDELEEEILSTWMVAFHIKGNMITEENMRNFLNSRDYRQYSSANLLKVLRDTHHDVQNDAHALMRLYDTQHLLKDRENKDG